MQSLSKNSLKLEKNRLEIELQRNEDVQEIERFKLLHKQNILRQLRECNALLEELEDRKKRSDETKRIIAQQRQNEDDEQARYMTAVQELEPSHVSHFDLTSPREDSDDKRYRSFLDANFSYHDKEKYFEVATLFCREMGILAANCPDEHRMNALIKATAKVFSQYPNGVINADLLDEFTVEVKFFPMPGDINDFCKKKLYSVCQKRQEIANSERPSNINYIERDYDLETFFKLCNCFSYKFNEEGK